MLNKKTKHKIMRREKRWKKKKMGVSGKNVIALKKIIDEKGKNKKLRP